MQMISRRLIRSLVLLASFSAPILVFAAGIDDQYIKGYRDSIISIINGILLPVLIAIAFIVFLYGVYKYFIQDEAEREKGKWFVLYGVIGFVIIFSIWGLVNILGITLNLPDKSAPPIPTIGGNGVKVLETEVFF